MLQTAQRGKKTSAKKAAPHERFLEAFRWMLLARTLEEKLVSLYRGGQITGGVYIGKGQEAVSVACGMFLQKGDIFAPLIRDQAGRSAFGEPIVDVARTYLGSRQGPMRGRDGNIHRGKPGDDQLAMISASRRRPFQDRQSSSRPTSNNPAQTVAASFRPSRSSRRRVRRGRKGARPKRRQAGAVGLPARVLQRCQ